MNRNILGVLLVLLLTACSPAQSEAPTVDDAYNINNEYYGIQRSLQYNSGSHTVDFYPATLALLPKGAKKLRYEGNGWYTFLWKGGCYMATVQDSGRWSYTININPAHHKEVCDLSVEPVEVEYEYEQQPQNTTTY